MGADGGSIHEFQSALVAVTELPGVVVQVPGTHGVASVPEPPPEQCPERLNAVGVHRPAAVLAASVVDAGMPVFGQTLAGSGFVGVEPVAGFQVSPYEHLRGFVAVVQHYFHPDHIGRPVLQPGNRGFADRSTSGA